MSASGALMRAGVERGQAWAATQPSMLIREGYLTVVGGNSGRTYDISPDGRRFLLMKAAGSESGVAPTSIVVVQHWDEELKARVPTQ